MSDWKKQLDSIFQKKDKQAERDKESFAMQERAYAETWDFIEKIVQPAFEELKSIFEERGRKVEVNCRNAYAVGMKISSADFHHVELDYHLDFGKFPQGRSSHPIVRSNGRDMQVISLVEPIKIKKQFTSLKDISKDDIIQSVVDHYEKTVSA